jgi:quercetin dioxygenase-like cupin family protein
MADATCKRIDDMEATFRGSMRKVRAELGLTSFGVQTIDIPPDSSRHPWHDHVEDGQEEMYIALEGSGVLELESGERFPLVHDCAIRVGPAERRHVVAGHDGIRVLIVGGTPGRAYERWQLTELGAPDPIGN